MQLSHYNLLGAHSQPSLAAKNALAQTIFKLSLSFSQSRARTGYGRHTGDKQ